MAKCSGCGNEPMNCPACTQRICARCGHNCPSQDKRQVRRYG